MRIWYLKRIAELKASQDGYIDFVIRAETEQIARNIAAKYDLIDHGIWKDKNKTTCSPLTDEGKREIITASYCGF